jgi:streptogramin lyase
MSSSAFVPGPRSSTIIALPGEAYDLAVDGTGDRLWLAVMRRDGQDELVSVNTESGRLESWLLPDSAYGGYVSRVRVAADGSVWISQPYRLVRFDPSTNRMSSIDFALDAEGAFADALDPGNPLPGTWISAIGARGSQMIVARNNVPFLDVYGADMGLRERIPVPDELAGAQDIATGAGGAIWAISGPTAQRAIVQIDRGGHVVRYETGGGARLETDGSDALTTGVTEGLTRLRADSSVPIGIESGRSDDSRFAVSGSTIDIYDAASGTITRFVGSDAVGSLDLGSQAIEVLTPNGGFVQGYIRPRVNDLALDGRGRLWYLDGNAESVVRVDW